MKALATVALIGLAYGFEDHEFRHGQGSSSRGGGHGVPHHKNSTIHKPHTLYPPGGRRPIPFNHTKEREEIRWTAPYQSEKYYHQRPHLIAKDFFPVPKTVPKQYSAEWNRTHISFRRNNQQPYHPIHKNGTHKPVHPQVKPHVPLNKHNITHAPHHKNHTQHNPNVQLKKQVQADEDDEFFVDDDELFFVKKNNSTHIPKPSNKYLDMSPDYYRKTNRTRPFHPVPHHNRTIHKNVVAHDDEEFFATEDDVLFDLAKLLADASKTVGDVKQNPKNYGELLNDAINIAKDIKRKDDFEDSELRRRA